MLDCCIVAADKTTILVNDQVQLVLSVQATADVDQRQIHQLLVQVVFEAETFVNSRRHIDVTNCS